MGCTQWRMDIIIDFADPSVCLQGTNGSQLWDTAFAVQAFIEVIFNNAWEVWERRGEQVMG